MITYYLFTYAVMRVYNLCFKSLDTVRSLIYFQSGRNQS